MMREERFSDDERMISMEFEEEMLMDLLHDGGGDSGSEDERLNSGDTSVSTSIMAQSRSARLRRMQRHNAAQNVGRQGRVRHFGLTHRPNSSLLRNSNSSNSSSSSRTDNSGNDEDRNSSESSGNDVASSLTEPPILRANRQPIHHHQHHHFQHHPHLGMHFNSTQWAAGGYPLPNGDSTMYNCDSRNDNIRQPPPPKRNWGNFRQGETAGVVAVDGVVFSHAENEALWARLFASQSS